jgi:hypothetical protein
MNSEPMLHKLVVALRRTLQDANMNMQVGYPGDTQGSTQKGNKQDKNDCSIIFIDATSVP